MCPYCCRIGSRVKQTDCVFLLRGKKRQARRVSPLQSSGTETARPRTKPQNSKSVLCSALNNALLSTRGDGEFLTHFGEHWEAPLAFACLLWSQARLGRGLVPFRRGRSVMCRCFGAVP